MSNRFHSKWHRRNHHTYGNPSNPDASHDPIASPQQPFLGDFVLSGALSAVAPLSAYAGLFYTQNTAISAYGGVRGIYAYGKQLGVSISSDVVPLSTNSVNNQVYPDPTRPYFGPNYISKNVLNNRTGIFTENPLSAFHVTGGTLLDGHCTITGNLSVLRDFTYLDTYVYITSATQIVLQNNSNQSPALLVSNSGENYVMQVIDWGSTSNPGASANLPALIVDGHSTRPGYVGMGTLLPATTLSVSSINTINTAVQGTYAAGFSNSTNAQTDVAIGSDTTYGYIQSFNSKPLQINKEGNHTLLNSKNTGYVGIWTTTPVVPLHVYGGTLGSSAGNSLEIARFQNLNNNGNNLRILQNRLSNGSDWTFAETRIQLTTDTTNQGYISFSPDANGGLAFGAGSPSTERVRISGSTGNVGIGTTSPAVKLDITSNSTVQSPANNTTVHVTQSDGVANRILGDAFGSSARVSFTGRSATGTASAPLSSAKDQVLCEFTGQGWGWNGYSSTSMGRMTINAAENWSDTAQGTYLTFQTSTIGTNTPSEKVRISDNGNVGIGTTSPSQLLHVVGNELIVPSAGWSGGNTAYLLLGDTYNYVNSQNGGNTRIAGYNGVQVVAGTTAASAVCMTIVGGNNPGNVGIGTTSPAVKLDITNNSNVQSVVKANNTIVHVTQSDGSAARLLLDSFVSSGAARSSFTGRVAGGTAASPSATSADQVLCEITGQGYGDNDYSSTSMGRMTINAAETWTNAKQGTYLTFQTSTIGTTSPSERVRIADNGNVGVGTTSPATLLHVNGGSLGGTSGNSLELARFSNGSGTGNVNNLKIVQNRLSNTNSTSWTSAETRIQIVTDTTSQAYISFNPDASSGNGSSGLAFGTGSSSSERMRIDSSGNVGIGTTTTGTLLTVNGPIATKAVYQPTLTSNAYTVLSTDSSLIISNGTTTVTLTLPTASSYPGRWLYIKNVTACAVNSAISNVLPLASTTAGTAILTNTAGKFAALQSDGTNWIIMMAN